MVMKKHVFTCIMVSILFIAGCSDQKSDKERKNKNTGHSNQSIQEEKLKIQIRSRKSQIMQINGVKLY